MKPASDNNSPLPPRNAWDQPKPTTVTNAEAYKDGTITMSQPKPTGEPCERCGGDGWIQDSQGDNNCEACNGTGIKPTGEWTAKMVREIRNNCGTLQATGQDIAVARAINAALAAERLRANQKEGAFMVASEANQQLREQLGKAEGRLRDSMKHYEALSRKLAAAEAQQPNDDGSQRRDKRSV